MLSTITNNPTGIKWLLMKAIDAASDVNGNIYKIEVTASYITINIIDMQAPTKLYKQLTYHMNKNNQDITLAMGTKWRERP